MSKTDEDRLINHALRDAIAFNRYVLSKLTIVRVRKEIMKEIDSYKNLLQERRRNV